MKQYEIINPSDACTIEAEDPLVAAVAILILGNGQYALRGEDDEDQPLPLLFLGGQKALDQWYEEHGIESLEKFIEEHRCEIATVLESTLYGRFKDRAIYNKGLELAGDDEAKRKEWRDNWEDQKRSSMTTICKNAWRYAELLRRFEPKEAAG